MSLLPASSLFFTPNLPGWFLEGISLILFAVILGTIQQWFVQKYPDEAILFTSKATFLEVGKKSPMSWLPRFYQVWGVAIITQRSLFFKSKFPSPAMFIPVAITLIPLAASAGFLYLIYFLYSGAGFRSFSALIPLMILLIPAFLFLMLALITGTSIFQYRPYQVRILFQDIQNSELKMVPGVTRRHPSLTLTTLHQTVNIVFTEPIPDEIIQLIPNPKPENPSSESP